MMAEIQQCGGCGQVFNANEGTSCPLCGSTKKAEKLSLWNARPSVGLSKPSKRKK